MAYDKYKEYDKIWSRALAAKRQFKKAGIPWHQKGSPHRYWLKYRALMDSFPFEYVIHRVLRANRKKIARNITQNNAFLARLTSRPASGDGNNTGSRGLR